MSVDDNSLDTTLIDRSYFTTSEETIGALGQQVYHIPSGAILTGNTLWCKARFRPDPRRGIYFINVIDQEKCDSKA